MQVQAQPIHTSSHTCLMQLTLGSVALGTVAQSIYRIYRIHRIMKGSKKGQERPWKRHCGPCFHL